MMSDIANANTLAEQMTRSLRLFRRRIEGSQDLIKKETKSELEREIQLTMKSLVGNGVETGVSNRSNEGDEMMMKMLGMYSEKLMIIMEEKMRGSHIGEVDSKTTPNQKD